MERKNKLCVEYKLLKKKGEGTFSEVLEAVHLKTGKRVAIKCMKKKYETLKKVNKLREIQALKMISPHENIIQLIEIL
jgi:renal tumor antigen